MWLPRISRTSPPIVTRYWEFVPRFDRTQGEGLAGGAGGDQPPPDAADAGERVGGMRAALCAQLVETVLHLDDGVAGRPMSTGL